MRLRSRVSPDIEHRAFDMMRPATLCERSLSVDAAGAVSKNWDTRKRRGMEARLEYQYSPRFGDPSDGHGNGVMEVASRTSARRRFW